LCRWRQLGRDWVRRVHGNGNGNGDGDVHLDIDDDVIELLGFQFG
jgi:hypothetical protein